MKIEASELRIGNLVNIKLNDSQIKWVPICPADILILYQDDIKSSNYSAVAITEELLLKLGFTKTGTSFYKDRFEMYKPVNWVNYTFYERNLMLREVKCAHTLQNLVFALTGTELTFKH